MVVFTCNHCGESVKKPAVEKHYSFKCRGAPKNVSCMDCQKDFHGEDYVVHIRCITEAEKYSGKDYVAKEPKNSGQKKQESWMDIIRSILDTKEYNLSNQARATFQKLRSVDNVPRKKAKFQNFVANCLRMRKDQAEEVWSILEKELEKMKAAKASATPTIGDIKKVENVETPTPATAENQRAQEDVEKNSTGKQTEKKCVKKSKKRKVDKEIQNTIVQDEEWEILQTATEMAEKVSNEPSKKKKKKNDKSVAKQDEVNAEQEPTISTTTPDRFQWDLVMLCTVRKYGDNMKLDKFKRKVERMYLRKRELPALTEKQHTKFDKKFTKHLKKCNLKVENDVVSVVSQKAGDK